MNTATILDTIGQTPLVRLTRLNPNPKVALYAKIEGFNPSGSVKDRAALRMIEAAEADGSLKPGQTIIEATSGNTGIGLAMVGAVKGYPVIIAMSEAVSEERRKILRAYGATLVLTPAEEGTDGAVRKVRDMIAKNPETYYYPNQYANPNTPLAHTDDTAEEIWAQTDGTVTHLVASIGTSGTLLGVAQGLKKHNPHIQIIEAQPLPGHHIQGLKNMEEAIVPPIYQPDAVDRHIMVADASAFQTARDIIANEGIFVGMSSGAALWAAQQVAEELNEGTIVTIFPDRGEKYLSTELFDS